GSRPARCPAARTPSGSRRNCGPGPGSTTGWSAHTLERPRARHHLAVPPRHPTGIPAMCGIIGIVATTEVATALYDGLTVLQHRGQDAAGIATANGTQLRVHKGNGLVRDVFEARAMRLLEGRVGIGHCRYPTAGSEGSDEAQPFYVNSPYGIALAHNGNLVNTDALRREVFEQDRRNINTQSDSEVLLNVFAHELDKSRTLTPEAAFRAIEGLGQRARGGYAAVATVLGLGLVAFRDPHGIRPLVLGKRETDAGN